MTLQPCPYQFTPLAQTGGPLADFAPYVAAINDDGVVAFQATLAPDAGGGEPATAVFLADGTGLTQVASSRDAACPVQAFVSHPDLDRAGRLTVYGPAKAGGAAVWRRGVDGSWQAVGAHGAPGAFGTATGFSDIGPLGPTMNEAGAVAFRARVPGGAACVALAWPGDAANVANVANVVNVANAGPAQDQARLIAVAGERFAAFEGLPVVNAQGKVLFRADLVDGRQGLFLSDGSSGEPVALVMTGASADAGPDVCAGFAELGRFPLINDSGQVAFVGTQRDGVSGVYVLSAGRLSCLVDTRAGFQSLRGVLINNAGPVVFYGTPVGGQLGLYAGPDPVAHRLLGLGDALLGGAVAEVVLNPVSVNQRGQLAVRVALDDGRQFILRGEPQR